MTSTPLRGRAALTALAASLLLAAVAGCTSPSAGASPAGPRMCGFETRSQLTAVVGPLDQIAPADPTVHGGCGWTVRDAKLLDSNDGHVSWDTSTSLVRSVGTALDTYTRVTVGGHPGRLGQIRGLTLLWIGAGDSIDDAGVVLVTLANGHRRTRDTVLTLGQAAMRYVDAHS